MRYVLFWLLKNTRCIIAISVVFKMIVKGLKLFECKNSYLKTCLNDR